LRKVGGVDFRPANFPRRILNFGLTFLHVIGWEKSKTPGLGIPGVINLTTIPFILEN
jgi:hypothetical protein